MTRVLVTGARGLLGRHLVPYLQMQGCDVFETDVHLGHDTRYATWDVTTTIPDRVWNFNPEIIYHLGAVCGRVVAEENPALALRVNVAGAHTVAHVAKTLGARLIHLSTSEVYGTALESPWVACQPQNWYGVTKHMGEQAVKYAYPQATIVRPFMMASEREPAGPHRSFLIRAAHAVKHRLPLELHEGSARSWLHVEDAVRWLWEMRATPFADLTLNIGSITPPVTNEYLVGLLEGAFGTMARVTRVPMPKRIRQVKTPDLGYQRQMLSPQQVSLIDLIHRIATFMETE